MAHSKSPNTFFRNVVVFLGSLFPLLVLLWFIQGANRPSGRTFWFRYTASFTDLPAQASQVRLWVPLAKTRENQEVLSRRIRTREPYEIREDPVFGNDILYLALNPPIAQPLEIAIDYDVVVHGGRWQGPGKLFLPAGGVASADELAVALRDEPLMVVNQTTAQLASEATVGRTGELEKARAIYDYVIAHMRYDKNVPGWGRGDTLRACSLGTGNCTDFHSLFISMGRSIGIPARFVIGVSIPQEPEGQIPGYHCWAEFYNPASGWVPVDASQAWKQPHLREYYFGTRDPDKFLISAGRNIQLVPAQAGPPVNFFVYPYVEVDGTPSGRVDTRFEFTNRNNKEAGT